MPEFKSHQKYFGSIRKEKILMGETYTGHIIILNPLVWNLQTEVDYATFKKDRIERAEQITDILRSLYPSFSIFCITFDSHTILLKYSNPLLCKTLRERIEKFYPEIVPEICNILYIKDEPWTKISSEIRKNIKNSCLIDEELEGDMEEHLGEVFSRKVRGKEIVPKSIRRNSSPHVETRLEKFYQSNPLIAWKDYLSAQPNPQNFSLLRELLQKTPPRPPLPPSPETDSIPTPEWLSKEKGKRKYKMNQAFENPTKVGRISDEEILQHSLPDHMKKNIPRHGTLSQETPPQSPTDRISSTIKEDLSNLQATIVNEEDPFSVEEREIFKNYGNE